MQDAFAFVCKIPLQPLGQLRVQCGVSVLYTTHKLGLHSFCPSDPFREHDKVNYVVVECRQSSKVINHHIENKKSIMTSLSLITYTV